MTEHKGIVPTEQAADDDEYTIYRVLLGLRIQNLGGLIKKMEAGFDYKYWKHFSKYTGFSEQQMLRITSISRTTLNRRKKSKSLNRDESERLARLARVYGKTLHMLGGDAELAREWFTTPLPDLNGSSPFDMSMYEAGAMEVEDIIGRIEYGVYA